MRGGLSISSYGIPPVVNFTHQLQLIKDKITVPMHMNIHSAAFLLGFLPAQRCGAVYCHVLKSLHLDVVLTSFQTSFHMQLSRSSRPDIVWALPPMLVTLDVPACYPADLEVEEKRDLSVALAFQRAAQQIALC